MKEVDFLAGYEAFGLLIAFLEMLFIRLWKKGSSLITTA